MIAVDSVQWDVNLAFSVTVVEQYVVITVSMVTVMKMMAVVIMGVRQDTTDPNVDKHVPSIAETYNVMTRQEHVNHVSLIMGISATRGASISIVLLVNRAQEDVKCARKGGMVIIAL